MRRRIPSYWTMGLKSQYHVSVGAVMRQNKARKRKERKKKIVTLCLCLFGLGVFFFFANMAGDSIIQKPPAEIYMAQDGYIDGDVLEFPAEIAACGEYLCISMKMLFIRSNDLLFLANNQGK